MGARHERAAVRASVSVAAVVCRWVVREVASCRGGRGSDEGVWVVKPWLGSASMLDRTLECPASNQLPQTAEVHPNAITAAEWGTAVHTLLETGELTPGHEAKLKEIPIQQTIAPLVPASGKEVAMVWRGETGAVEVLGNGLGRDYGELGPKDVSGTADVVLTGYKTLEVFDYKTGKTVPDPAESAQLKHLAMMAAKVRPSVDVVVAGFQRVRVDGRKKTDRVTVRDEYTVLSKVDLDMHERRLKRALVVAEQVRDDIGAGKDPQVKEGQWCFFCPSRLVCPAKKGK